MTTQSQTVVEELGNEFVVVVIFNDGYTKPMQLGGYYKTRKGAEKKLERHLHNMALPNINLCD